MVDSNLSRSFKIKWTIKYPKGICTFTVFRKQQVI